MTEDRLPLAELLQKAGDGDFLRGVAEAAGAGAGPCRDRSRMGACPGGCRGTAPDHDPWGLNRWKTASPAGWPPWRAPS
jgi:hypothetical protein